MSPEDHGALPVPQPQSPSGENTDPVLSAGLSIAMKWGVALGPEKLEIALKALEPQLKRDHQALMHRIASEREAAERADAAASAAAERASSAAEAEAARRARENRDKRAHSRHMVGLTVGAVIAIAMLGAGVYVVKDAWWLAALLCGPSLLALAKIFVLRRSDPDDMKFVSAAARNATNAASQVQQPPVP